MVTEEPIAVYDEDDRACLIIKSTKGSIYTNQAGGIRCAHPKERGFFFPIPVETRFDDGFCLCESRDGLQSARLWRSLDALGLKLDEDLLDESMEGWLHVVLECGLKAVLAYGNCD